MPLIFDILELTISTAMKCYPKVFVCLSAVFPSVFATVEYSMAIIDSLKEFDVLILRSMAEGLPLSLDQIFPIAQKPDKSGINLRAMSKEKNMPLRKNPLVMCFEGAFVFLAISRGRFNELLIPSIDEFLIKYKEFNPEIPISERVEIVSVKIDERDKFFKKLNPPELNLLFRCSNIMACVVEMTNDKAFKCCELAVRLIEGETGQGFKPGGDNGPRILHRMHLHTLQVKEKLKRQPIRVSYTVYVLINFYPCTLWVYYFNYC